MYIFTICYEIHLFSCLCEYKMKRLFIALCHYYCSAQTEKNNSLISWEKIWVQIIKWITIHLGLFLTRIDIVELGKSKGILRENTDVKSKRVQSEPKSIDWGNFIWFSVKTNTKIMRKKFYKFFKSYFMLIKKF